MKKHFIGTFTELQDKLDYMVEKKFEIINVEHVSDLCEVPSFFDDNMIRVFLIETEDKGQK